MPVRPNRLINEKSPYLLQHAHNPVDWYPWGEEAFDKARAENKPVFLSVGYSTCHWCHVMEKESFEDEEVARLMNDAFVSIKVDREERPDIDEYFMMICQILTGGGGWPLTIIMTPEKKPFFAGTYIPKKNRFGRMGMVELIPHVNQLWISQKEKIDESTTHISIIMNRVQGDDPGDFPKENLLDSAYDHLERMYDQQNGGFGNSPKFPTPHMLTFLLRYWRRIDNAVALKMVEKTLDAMRLGGIYDHVGYGFHRYSTDAGWLIPHFEKMLYDQAMLAMAYTEAYQATGREKYKDTVREIFTYVIDDMTDHKGAFYSAEDADSEGEEGKFYLWTEKEIRGILNDDEFEAAVKAFNVKAEGNYPEESTGEKSGRNILHLKYDTAKSAAEMNIPEEKLKEMLESIRQKLFAAREKRERPLRDDKILTDWNGLMIAALAKAGRVFDQPEYSRVAANAAQFILDNMNMRDGDGKLYHRFCEGEAAIPAFLDDYAFFIWGLLELYEATFKVDYLETAIEFNDTLLKYFWDANGGGFFLTPENSADLPVRTKDIHDGATPSGNSVAMLNLIRLAKITGRTDLENKAFELAKTFSKKVTQSPAGHTQFLAALDFALGPSREVVIAGEREGDDTMALIKTIYEIFIPNKVVVLHPLDKEASRIEKIAKYTKTLKTINGKAAAYVCKDYNCSLPTTEPELMLEIMKKGLRD